MPNMSSHNVLNIKKLKRVFCTTLSNYIINKWKYGFDFKVPLMGNVASHKV